MKISKYFYTLVLAVMAAGALSLASCSKDKDEAPQPEPEPVPVVPEKTLVEKVESIVISINTAEKQINIDGTKAITVTYLVTPSELASQLAEHKDWFSMTGVDAPAKLTITDVKGTANGELNLTLEPSGFEQGKDYRTALNIKDEKASYTTSYTNIYVVQTVGVDNEGRNQDKAESR